MDHAAAYASEDVCVTLPWDDAHIYTWHFLDEWELKRQPLDLPAEIQTALYSFMRHYIHLTSLHGLSPVHPRLLADLEGLHPPTWPSTVHLQSYVGMIWVHCLMHRIDRRTLSGRRIPVVLAPVEAWALMEALDFVIHDLSPLYQAENAAYPFRDFGYFPEVMHELARFARSALSWLEPAPKSGHYRIIAQLPQSSDWDRARSTVPTLPPLPSFS